MPDRELGRRRLVAQGVVTRPFARPADAVAALGAMQGQDLPGVIASAALRTREGTVADVVEDLDAGRIVRGYPMRGTVFLLAAADATWMGQLCAGPALRGAERRQSDLGLTSPHIARARDALVTALEDHPTGLSRGQVMELWDSIGQPTSGGRGYHLLAQFVSETLAFYGPWNGTDQNIVLARDWVPPGSGLEGRFNGDRIAAVTELLRRYLTSHGPATIRDFAWWTKLPLKEIRAALPDAARDLDQDDADEPAYWRPGLIDEVTEHAKDLRKPWLLPGFDEFILGYQDRSFAMSEAEVLLLSPGKNGMFRRSVVVDGQVRALWKRGGRPGRRALELEPFDGLPKRAEAALPRLFEAFPFTTV
ncbi:winged helix DNA-binding domain-containing protein [Ornithinimicrobium sp. F0845]|uniref:winged helix DNA-binding domain-containing protein n=1 Tax=Ornithinimicrobium sp. F0845 TaxID=2926412 RepID=UPI001FF11DC3|nr:winged helix DNA-binding domain-containing protein [Ornithinimicrobium sp. F0845]MCK0112558.1 winged helix DNA-binding domain-containing protein [Ornithinimicrobium sp. F0845]